MHGKKRKYRQRSLKNAKENEIMAKIDISTIEGYSEMTAEEKLEILEAMELPEPDFTGWVKKDALDKVASEAAAYKKQLRERMTEEEAKAAKEAEEKATLIARLEQLEQEKFVVTAKGRETAGLTEDSIAFTVKQRAENAVDRFNRQLRRSSFVKTQIIPRENGDCSVIMSLDDEVGNLMTLELLAPNQRQAVRLSRLFEQKAEAVYNLTMAELLDDEDELND